MQPTISTTAYAWIDVETRTEPVDDLIRFRQTKQDDHAAAFLLLLTIPLPRILKELRLLHKAGRRLHRQTAP